MVFFNHRSIVRESSLYKLTWRTRVITESVIDFSKAFIGIIPYSVTSNEKTHSLKEECCYFDQSCRLGGK